MAEQQQLRDSLLPQFYRFDRFSPTPMMSRSEVVQMAQVHEIGAHSFAHASMEFETDELFSGDLAACRDYFRDVLDVQTAIYAFPNGSYRPSQVQAALAFGYRHVLIVGDRFSHPGSSVHSRFGFEARSLREVHFRSLGGQTSPINSGAN